MTEVRAPSLPLLLLESRAFWELGAYFASRPLQRLAPAGDGHPVLILPGLGASDISTHPLRAFLRRRGYWVHGWKLGRNIGDPMILKPLAERLHALRQRHGRKISLIGWSMGGLFARELAKLAPGDVRLVITLASPFAGPPGASNVQRAYKMLSGRDPKADTALSARLRQPPPVPVTSIYSRSDGIVAWQSCVEKAGAQMENVKVHSSHLGMGCHPHALFIIADRLAQPEGQWTPFQRGGLPQSLFCTSTDARRA